MFDLFFAKFDLFMDKVWTRLSILLRCEADKCQVRAHRHLVDCDKRLKLGVFDR